MVEPLTVEDSGIGFPVDVSCEEEIPACNCQGEAGRCRAPSAGPFPSDSSGCCDAEEEELKKVGEEDRGESVVVISFGTVGHAEGTVESRRGTISQVQAARIDVCEFEFECFVLKGKGVVGAQRGKSRKEHVGGGLQSGGG